MAVPAEGDVLDLPARGRRRCSRRRRPGCDTSQSVSLPSSAVARTPASSENRRMNEPLVVRPLGRTCVRRAPQYVDQGGAGLRGGAQSLYAVRPSRTAVRGSSVRRFCDSVSSARLMANRRCSSASLRRRSASLATHLRHDAEHERGDEEEGHAPGQPAPHADRSGVLARLLAVEFVLAHSVQGRGQGADVPVGTGRGSRDQSRSRCRPRSGRPTGVRPQTIRTPLAAGRWCVSGRSSARCGPSGSRHW